MKVKYPLVREPSDILHFALGILSGFFPEIGFFIAVVYFLYQNREREHFWQTLKDIAVYVYGFIVGLSGRWLLWSMGKLPPI